VASVDVSTAAGSANAIATIDSALANINSSRANLGAVQNRFSSVVSNLATTSENLTASRSRILDADFAAETANLTRAQILQQAGTAMLAQANSLPQNVLSLLRG
jgi:flagellin